MSIKQTKSGRVARPSGTLDNLRRKVSPEQRHLLDMFLQHYHKYHQWPVVRVMYSHHGGKRKLRDLLRGLGGDVVAEVQDQTSTNRFELSVVGLLLTEGGEKFRKLLIQYLEFLRKQFQTTPEKVDFTDKDFVQALRLSEQDRVWLGRLVDMSRLSKGGGRGEGSWNIRVPDEVEDLPPDGPIDGALDSLLFRWFHPERPVFLDERKSDPPLSQVITPPNRSGERKVPEGVVRVDVLKRRYQVFVSSTYEDLKEERQQVIQALLETKCIPLGMELFPAASVQQWELIKRVIAECDYYIVIIGGRYGSVNDAGQGYTEREFDYATEIGKPVIGFYHKNPENLPGSKLEKNDVGREKLKAFTEKVKRRLCRPWSSAAELGSAVKSAIIGELEFNPTPGWVRADSVPASDTVEKLKQRIADLEEKLKHRGAVTRPTFASGTESLRMPVVLHYDFKKKKEDPGEETPQKQRDHYVEIKWDDFVLIFAEPLLRGSKLSDLRYVLDCEIKARVLPEIIRSTGTPKSRYDCYTPEERVDLVLNTLVARKLVKMEPGGYYGAEPEFKFSQRGIQYLAEIQAVRSAD